MLLHTLLIVAAGALPAADTEGDTAREVEQAVHAIQSAFNKGDVDTLTGMMTRDHATVLSYARFANAADQLKILSDWKFSEYRIEGLEVKGVTRDVALVWYL